MAPHERIGSKTRQVPNGDDPELLFHEIFLWMTRFRRKELRRLFDRRNYVGKFWLSKND